MSDQCMSIGNRYMLQLRLQRLTTALLQRLLPFVSRLYVLICGAVLVSNKCPINGTVMVMVIFMLYKVTIAANKPVKNTLFLA